MDNRINTDVSIKNILNNYIEKLFVSFIFVIVIEIILGMIIGLVLVKFFNSNSLISVFVDFIKNNSNSNIINKDYLIYCLFMCCVYYIEYFAIIYLSFKQAFCGNLNIKRNDKNRLLFIIILFLIIINFIYQIIFLGMNNYNDLIILLIKIIVIIFSVLINEKMIK